MKIVCIIPDRKTLLSVVDEETNITEFRHIFDQWSDVEYLYDFFEKNLSDLGGITIKSLWNHPKSWLRIYAIRINPETYIVTGGAIKLTQTMQERPHTNGQLTRLNQVRDYLIQEGFDENDIEETEIDP